MKCEICHKAEAETAIVRGEGDGAEELYVCRTCAKAERVKSQKKSQRTRKVTGLPPGMSMSITEVGGDGETKDVEPPPIIGALVDAFQNIVDDITKIHEGEKQAVKSPGYHDFPLARVAADYRIGARLHLEGLHLIGELDAVKRAAHALSIELVGVEADGVRDTGHIYNLRYEGTSTRVKCFVEDLLREERNARVRLFEEMPRVFGDALCRALAILKNCRLLSPGEFFDLLSPLRLAAKEDMLDGISSAAIEKMLLGVDLSNAESTLGQEERDRMDAERADEMNRKFEDVVINERAEGRFI